MTADRPQAGLVFTGFQVDEGGGMSLDRWGCCLELEPESELRGSRQRWRSLTFTFDPPQGERTSEPGVSAACCSEPLEPAANQQLTSS